MQEINGHKRRTEKVMQVNKLETFARERESFRTLPKESLVGCCGLIFFFHYFFIHSLEQCYSKYISINLWQKENI